MKEFKYFLVMLTAVLFAAVGFSANRISPEDVNFKESDDGIIHPVFFVNPTLRSAYLTSGKLGSNRPTFTFESGMKHKLGDFGYFGLNVWVKNDLTKEFLDTRRDWANEIDYIIYYGYKWKFAEGWALDSSARFMWDVCYGRRTDTPRTLHEWRWRETLEMPWINFYAQVRAFIKPVDCAALRLGVTKRYEIFDDVFLAPDITIYGGTEEWHYYRFGYYTEEKPHYSIGPNSMTAQIDLVYKPSDNFEFFVGFGQWGIIMDAMRRQMKERKGPLGRRDLTYAHMGLKITFP